MFVVAAFCTVSMVFLCYFLIIVHAYAECLVGAPPGAGFFLGPQAAALGFYLYFFAAAADDCFESFKEIALPLR